MRHRGVSLRQAIAMGIALCAVARAATVDFESVRPGTRWGSETGHQPGDSALSESDIMMSVETFFFNPSQTEFFRAEVPEVQGRFAQAFPTQELTLDGINVLFDFSGLRFDVDFVSFEFADFGGTNNLAVNGGSMNILDPLSGLPSNVAPGITAVIVGNRIELGAVGTTINSLTIGGQELVIDNVTAVPEPATVVFLVVGVLVLFRRRLTSLRPRARV